MKRCSRGARLDDIPCLYVVAVRRRKLDVGIGFLIGFLSFSLSLLMANMNNRIVWVLLTNEIALSGPAGAESS